MFRNVSLIVLFFGLNSLLWGAGFRLDLSEVDVLDVGGNTGRWHSEPVYLLNPQGRLLEIQKTVVLPEPYLPLAVHLSAMASSEVFWNGQLIGKNGVPSFYPSKELPGVMDYVLQIPPELVKKGENDFRVTMSSHHNVLEVSYPVHRITISTPSLGIQNKVFFYIPSLMTAGSFLLATLYFGVLVFEDRGNKLAFPIALMALFACLQLISELIRGLWAYPYPFHVWRLILITLFAGSFSLSVTTYVTRRFLPKYRKMVLLMTIIATVPFVLFVPGYDSKAILSLFIPSLVSVFSIIPSLKKERRSNVVILVFLVLFATLAILQGSMFLDVTYYLFAALLIASFFFDQARQMNVFKSAQVELEKRNAQMELELIKRRIAPHFLMNTLNALSEWVESDPSIAVKMIDSLAKEFRALSAMCERNMIPILEEIQLCEYHLQIMSYRMDQDYELATSGIDQRLEIPPGVIHTQLENAFTHSRYRDGAQFKLSQTKKDESIILELECPEQNQQLDHEGSSGQGRSYIEKRLSANFGLSASFEQMLSSDGRWKSRIVINS